MQRTTVAMLLGFTALGAFTACGQSSSSDNANDAAQGGTSGASSGSSGSSSAGGAGAPSSGGASTGGIAGTTSTGGNAMGGSGATTTGGSAGTSPTGGVGGSGTGGSAGGGRECETSDDCIMFTDCCTCAAIPKGTSLPSCERLCITDSCSSQQIGTDEAICNAGRCMINRTCNQNRITCPGDPTPCPSGSLHSVDQNGCYGPCIPVTDCRDVTNCEDCGDAVCVTSETSATTSCVIPEDGCTKGNYCECLGACSAQCSETDDGIGCYCITC